MTAAPRRRIIPGIEAFEERVAIAEYDGGLPRSQAENLAAQVQVFATADAYWQWLADYVVSRGIGQRNAHPQPHNTPPSGCSYRVVGRESKHINP